MNTLNINCGYYTNIVLKLLVLRNASMMYRKIHPVCIYVYIYSVYVYMQMIKLSVHIVRKKFQLPI